jgi:hypothetical protein
MDTLTHRTGLSTGDTSALALLNFGPFRASKRANSGLLKRAGLVPARGPRRRAQHRPMQRAGPARREIISCRAVLGPSFFFVLRARLLGPTQMYTYTNTQSESLNASSTLYVSI